MRHPPEQHPDSNSHESQKTASTEPKQKIETVHWTIIDTLLGELEMKIFAYALLLILAVASVSEARQGRLLKRARHPFGSSSCSGGVCK